MSSTGVTASGLIAKLSEKKNKAGGGSAAERVRGWASQLTRCPVVGQQRNSSCKIKGRRRWGEERGSLPSPFVEGNFFGANLALRWGSSQNEAPLPVAEGYCSAFCALFYCS